jgi:serine/threonine protein kinase
MRPPCSLGSPNSLQIPEKKSVGPPSAPGGDLYDLLNRTPTPARGKPRRPDSIGTVPGTRYATCVLSSSQIIDGYLLLRPVGSGGFGEIWICQSEALGDLRALKFIPAHRAGHLEKEFQALCLYRNAAGKLRSPSLMPVEHANRFPAGLFYVMPLADGISGVSALEEGWQPKTLSAVIIRQHHEPGWFGSGQIKKWMISILEGLQLLSDAGLVHRDVKPDNILFLNDSPCLSDISLLGEDAHQLTRRGTPGFSAPSWFIEGGGHPDMYGAALTLYSLLTGNPPDKMGRANFRWPPQGESSLSSSEREEWLRMHAALRRAVDERPAERFADFNLFAKALTDETTVSEPNSLTKGPESCKNLPQDDSQGKKQRNRSSVIAAGIIGSGLAFLAYQVVRRDGPLPSGQQPFPETGARQEAQEPDGPEIQEFEAALSGAIQRLTFPREKFAAEMDSIAADLYALDPGNTLPPGTRYKPPSEIKERFLNALNALPTTLDVTARGKVLEDLHAMTNRIGSKHGPPVRETLEEKIRRLESELNTDAEFRKEQGMKVLKNATALVNIRPESWEIIRPAQNFTFFGKP